MRAEAATALSGVGQPSRLAALEGAAPTRPAAPAAPTPTPTIWGLTPSALHDRFWASWSVQVVRQGEGIVPSPDAELFLLVDSDLLTIFRIAQLAETLHWLRPRLLFVRLHNTREVAYRERVLADAEDRFAGFQRAYQTRDWRLDRVAITQDREVAELWGRVTDRDAWRRLRRAVPARQRSAVSVRAAVFDRSSRRDASRFVHELATVWRRPDATVPHVRQVHEHVWSDRGVSHAKGTRFIGPVWVGAGRSIAGTRCVVGPAVLWDDPVARPDVATLDWDEIGPLRDMLRRARPRRVKMRQRVTKRAFDFLFAAVAILLSLPLYPLIMLAILLEDGRPFFFAHRRETLGGREFPCLKFRTMRKDSEAIKQRLMQQNQADGPQFFIDDDPRITRVGRVLRKANLDEIPQFFNVLLGQMSVVGPRPSPYKENQYCPPWREARLSVTPGITGLWQVSRSRRAGEDFQEWIRYDIQYVENWSWWLDLKIIYRTVRLMLGCRP